MLALEIELLTGAFRAALPDGSGPEWPPHPERIFSALVQSWVDGAHQEDERKALEWLEQLEPPAIEAAELVSSRDAPTVYVPPNDFHVPQPSKPFEWPADREGRRKPIRDITWAGIEPGIRAWGFRQPRTFKVAVPAGDRLAAVWEVARPDRMAAPLDRLASRVSNVGHSSSLVRCAWSERSASNAPTVWRLSQAGSVSLRVPYAGRLADLERWWKEAARPRSRAWARYAPPEIVNAPPPRSVFGREEDWFVFAAARNRHPDVLALAHVAKRVRDALMKVGPQPVPALLSGHGPDGGPAREAHIAVLPLPDVGEPDSRGTLIGFAIVLPRRLAPEARPPILKAIAALARPVDHPSGFATIWLSKTFSWKLELCLTPSQALLRPGRWSRSGKAWASVTPVVLDRFPKRDDPREIAQILAQACRNIGLPEPEEIEIGTHSIIPGSPNAYFPPRSHLAWTFPAGSKFANRPRRHVLLRFSTAVTGPVVLGAGRYHGFGLCMPLD